MLQNTPPSLFCCNGACLAVFSSLQPGIIPVPGCHAQFLACYAPAPALKWVIAVVTWSMATEFLSLHYSNGALQRNNGALQHSNGALQHNNGALQRSNGALLLVFDDCTTRYVVVPGCNEP